MFELITPASYWILTILWLVILGLYLSKLRQSKVIGGAVAVLLSILAIDAFRTVFESVYFGLYFNSLFGLLPKGIYDVLSQPALLIIPKLLNVIAGLLVLFLLIRRWVPREIHEREEWVTTLQESEKKHRILFQTMAQGVVYQDAIGNIISANPSAETLLGLSLDQMQGRTSTDPRWKTIHDDGSDFPGETHPAMIALKTGKKISDVVMGVFNPMDDNYRWIIVDAIPQYRDGEDKPYQVFTTFTNITDRKLQTEELLVAKQEAEKANTAKSEFLASMSHELRTPLNAVLGFAQMLEYDAQNPLSTVQKEHVDSILYGGNHLLELVNEVLDLAKIEANQLTLFVEEVTVGEVIADCVAMTNLLGEQRGITIVNHVCDGPLVVLRTDKMRMKQALLNLISNAIKFNKDHGTVTIDGGETDDGFLRISVTDTGVGIAKADHASVFHMFHRLGADPTIAQEGTGIGLTVTKLLVERMAGRIGFESEVGVGSTFWLELPLASNEDVIILADPQQSA